MRAILKGESTYTYCSCLRSVVLCPHSLHVFLMVYTVEPLNEKSRHSLHLVIGGSGGGELTWIWIWEATMKRLVLGKRVLIHCWKQGQVPESLVAPFHCLALWLLLWPWWRTPSAPLAWALWPSMIRALHLKPMSPSSTPSLQLLVLAQEIICIGDHRPNGRSRRSGGICFFS